VGPERRHEVQNNACNVTLFIEKKLTNQQNTFRGVYMSIYINAETKSSGIQIKLVTSGETGRREGQGWGVWSRRILS
jgi:hypothetical protein